MKSEQGHILLACATEAEMRAAVGLLPGAAGLELRGCAPPVCTGVRPEAERPFPGLPRLDLPGLTLHLLICGVGPVGAALSMSFLLGRGRERRFAWRGALNLGLAGSYDSSAAPVGSLVLATEERFPAYGIWPDAHECLACGPENGTPGTPLPLSLPQTETYKGPVYDRLELDVDNALGNMGLTCHTGALRQSARPGVCLTVAAVSGTPGRAARLARLFGGLAENMEGFSLALACCRANLPFAELRAVSNLAGQRPPSTWDMPGALAALARGGQLLFSPYL